MVFDGRPELVNLGKVERLHRKAMSIMPLVAMVHLRQGYSEQALWFRSANSNVDFAQLSHH
jgi:hypothetical protein